MNTSSFHLTPNDAYAFRRVLSKLDVPDDLILSPLANLLLKTLDLHNNPAGWQTLQDIATRDHHIMQQIMYIDPSSQSFSRCQNHRMSVGSKQLARLLNRRWIHSGARKGNAPGAISNKNAA
jgi:hypothetical protein